ncbi:hypothetical protein B0H11DRAFT_1913581 [Mycena galericulata]|nr:hypothetical protein B0H11DRAFT_1913581 [Mycena galericulata]
MPAFAVQGLRIVSEIVTTCILLSKPRILIVVFGAQSFFEFGIVIIAISVYNAFERSHRTHSDVVSALQNDHSTTGLSFLCQLVRFAERCGHHTLSGNVKESTMEATTKPVLSGLFWAIPFSGEAAITRQLISSFVSKRGALAFRGAVAVSRDVFGRMVEFVLYRWLGQIEQGLGWGFRRRRLG